MKKKIRLTLLSILIATAMLLGGCGSTASYNSQSSYPTSYSSAKGAASDGLYAEETASYEAYEEAAAEYDNGGSASSVLQSDRKLIKNVYLDAETYDLAEMRAAITAKTEALGGYIQSTQIYGGADDDSDGTVYYSRYTGRSAWYQVRIPAAQLDSFVESITEKSNIISQSENVQDITLEYVDTESRKNALKAEEKRLLEIMDKAENVSDIIAIESELTNVRYQLESIESQLKTYDNQVDYSTVNINITEVREYTVNTEKLSAKERIVNGFTRSVKDLTNGLYEFAIWFVIHIPYIILWAIIIAVIVLIIRKIFSGRKHREKKEKKSAKKPEEKVTETQAADTMQQESNKEN